MKTRTRRTTAILLAALVVLSFTAGLVMAAGGGNAFYGRNYYDLPCGARPSNPASGLNRFFTDSNCLPATVASNGAISYDRGAYDYVVSMNQAGTLDVAEPQVPGLTPVTGTDLGAVLQAAANQIIALPSGYGGGIFINAAHNSSDLYFMHTAVNLNGRVALFSYAGNYCGGAEVQVVLPTRTVAIAAAMEIVGMCFTGNLIYSIQSNTFLDVFTDSNAVTWGTGGLVEGLQARVNFTMGGGFRGTDNLIGSWLVIPPASASPSFSGSWNAINDQNPLTPGYTNNLLNTNPSMQGRVLTAPSVTTAATPNRFGTKVSVQVFVGSTATTITISAYGAPISVSGPYTNTSPVLALLHGQLITLSQTTGVSWSWVAA